MMRYDSIRIVLSNSYACFKCDTCSYNYSLNNIAICFDDVLM